MKNNQIEKLHSAKKIDLLNGNLRDSASIARVLREAKPDEVYNLAAQSMVRQRN